MMGKEIFLTKIVASLTDAAMLKSVTGQHLFMAVSQNATVMYALLWDCAAAMTLFAIVGCGGLEIVVTILY